MAEKMYIFCVGVLMASIGVQAQHQTSAEHQMPSGHQLFMGPVPGITTAWHPAPPATAIPLGTSIQLKRWVDSDATISWIGAREIANDDNWSVAEQYLGRLGRHIVRAEIEYANGHRPAPSRCEFNVVDYSSEDIEILSVEVGAQSIVIDNHDVNASTYEYFMGDSIANVDRISEGYYRTSVGKLVSFRASVAPDIFAPIVEWRSSEAPKRIGPNIALSFESIGEHVVSVGMIKSKKVVVDTYRSVITSHTDRRDFIPEGEYVTFTARTEPPGLESEITWLASTKFGLSEPLLGKGSEFAVAFNNTWGELPDGSSFQWLGVKADNAVFDQDQKCLVDSIELPVEIENAMPLPSGPTTHSGESTCFYRNCPGATELCFMGPVPGATSNVDVRFIWVGECRPSAGSCPVVCQGLDHFFNQPPNITLLCSGLHPQCANICNGLCPASCPPRIATKISFIDPSSGLEIYSCSPGKIDCSCGSATCP